MANNKQLAKNGIFNLGSFVVNIIISFFFTPYLIRVVGKESYSFFPLVNNIIGYSSIITAAVSGMAGRFITMHFYDGKIEEAKSYFNSVFVANVILSLFFSLLAAIGIIYISDIITVPSELETTVQILFAFGCASLILSTSTSILSIGTYVKNRVDLSSSRILITNVVRVACILLLFAIFKPSIIYMSLSAFVAALLGMYFNYSFKSRLLPEIPIAPRRYFSFDKIKTLISSSIWNSVNQLSYLLLTQLDLLITNIFIGVAATGDYSIAKMIPALMYNLFATLAYVFIPQFNILYAKKKTDELNKEILKSIKIMGLAVTIPIGFLAIYGVKFFDLWVPGQDSELIHQLQVLSIVPMVITGTINTLFHVYTITDKLKVPSIILLINGLINVALILAFLKFTNLALWSIPLASLITLLLKALTFTPMYAAKCLNLPYFYFHGAIAKGCLSFVVVAVMGYIISLFIEANTWMSLILCGVLTAVVALAINSFVFLSKSDRFYLSNIFKTKVLHRI